MKMLALPFLIFATWITSGLVLHSQDAWTSTTPQQPTPAISIYFSPHGGCTDAIVAEVAAAKESILVQSYTFTSTPIANALIAAKQRGISVEACCDEHASLAPGWQGKALSKAGCKVYLDGKHPIAHSKTITIDGKTVITGSYNYGRQAESNLENLLIIRVPSVAKQYVDNWNLHKAHSQALAP